MSAFLGPIHLKMYDRILYQDFLTESILDLAETKGWDGGLRRRVDAKAEPAPRKPLETVIDQSNIHGWLSRKVEAGERRLALAVTGILAGHPERMGDLQALMKDLGSRYDLTLPDDAENIFAAVHDILLDGMPCDFPFNITESDAAKVRWQVTKCPHAPYWLEAGGDVEVYYRLRDAWIEGLLDGRGLAHVRSAGGHCLRKEAVDGTAEPACAGA